MRNPNRLVGLVCSVLLVLGGLWWIHQERLAQRPLQEATLQKRVSGGKASVSPSSTAGSLASSHSVMGAAPDAGLAKTAKATKAPSAISRDSSKPSAAANGEKALARFKDWATSYAQAGSAQKPAVTRETLELAQERKHEMERLSAEDPKKFLSEVLPYELRRELPPEVLSEMEKPVSGLTQLSPMTLSLGDAAGSANLYLAQLNGEEYVSRFAEPTYYSVANGLRPVHGAAIGNAAVLSGDPVRVLSPIEAQDLSDAGKLASDANSTACGADAAVWVDVGGKYQAFCNPAEAAAYKSHLAKVYGPPIQLADVQPGQTNASPTPLFPGAKGRFDFLISRFRFPEDPEVLMEEDQLTEIFNSLAGLMRKWSFSTLEIVPHFTPVFTLPQTRRYYARSPIATEQTLAVDAVAVARQAGYSIPDYRFFYAFFPKTTNAAYIPFAGWNFVGGLSLSWDTNLAPTQLRSLIQSIGFGFGLGYGNLLDTRVPGSPPPLPNSIADSDSVYGHDTIQWAGLWQDMSGPVNFYNVQQADPFEAMGRVTDTNKQPAGQFGLINKRILGWISPSSVPLVTKSTSVRIYAEDSDVLHPENIYGVTVHKDVLRDYWIEHRRKFTDNPYLMNGVLLHFGAWGTSPKFTSQLIDATPGTPAGFDDAAIIVGRTYADTVNQVYITPTQVGQDEKGEWIDVTVNLGDFSSNHRPTFQLLASQTRANTNQIITFTADSVADADGDTLAFRWDLGDGTFGPNAPVVQKSYPAGQYVVRCEVSDMKGGLRSAHVLITVGDAHTTQVFGHVFDTDGNPVEGARVAILGTSAWVDFTDSDGFYQLAGITNTTATNVAYLFGYHTVPLNFANSSPIDLGGGGEFDFLAIPIPSVSVQSSGDVDASKLGVARFTFKRTGDTNGDLTAFYRVDGTALAGVNYTADALTNVVVFPAGVTQVDVPIQAQPNTAGGGLNTLTVSMLMMTNQPRFIYAVTNFGDTNTLLVLSTNYTVPGWFHEESTAEQIIWTQTDPFYVLGQGEARVGINDPTPGPAPVITPVVWDDASAENGQDAATFLLTLATPAVKDLDVHYTLGGTASNGVDYLALPGLVTIKKGSTSAAIRVIALPDQLIEGNETVIITLDTNTPNYSISSSQQLTAIIVDDDLPLLFVNTPQASASAFGAEPGIFRITRSGSVQDALQIHYFLGGTATNGLDYVTLSGSATIPAGSSFVEVSVRPTPRLNNTIRKTVELTLSSSPTYNVGNPSVAHLDIEPDGLARISVVASVANAVEGGNVGVFTISRFGFTSSITNKPLTVQYELGGTADNGTDYRALSGFATIPAGATNTTVNINAILDSVHEETEYVNLRLLSSSDYSLTSTGRFAQVIITDANPDRLPTVGFEVSESTVSEATLQDLQIGVFLSAQPALDRTPILVEYHIIAGSATYSNDYFYPDTNSVGTTGYLAFNYKADGSIDLMTNIDVAIIQDTIREKTESVLISLVYPQLVYTSTVTNTNLVPAVVLTNYSFPATNFVLADHRFHTIHIVDDDGGTVSVAALSPFAYESGAQSGAFRISRKTSAGLTEPQTVRFDIVGTATPGSDYDAIATHEVIIPVGKTFVDVTVKPFDDTVMEGPETVKIVLTDAPGGALDLSASTAVVTIVDDDGTIQFPAREFHAAETIGQFQIPVVRIGDTTLQQTVDYTVLPGTAQPDVDYAATSGTLVFAPGETQQSIPIAIFDDNLVELPETLTVQLSNPSGGVALGGQQSATLIIDSDDAGFVFSTNSFAVAEYASTLTVTVQRVGNTNGAASVHLNTFLSATDTATVDDDFTAFDAVLNFVDGQSATNVSVAIKDDNLLEGDETFSLQLSEPSAGNLIDTNAATALAVILDDECQVEFTDTQFSVYENGVTAKLTLHRIGSALNTIAVDYATTNDTAIAGKDYTAVSGSVLMQGQKTQVSTNGSGAIVLSPGQRVATIEIPILDDTIGEPNKSFNVLLSRARTVTSARAAGSTTFGTNVAAAVLILDNELGGNVDTEYGDGLDVEVVDGQTGVVRGVNSIVLQPTGRAVFAGDFLRVNGLIFNHVARATPTGDLDQGFNPGVGSDGTVLSTATTADGRVFLGGTFRTVGGVTTPGLALITADGTLDPTFNVGLGSDRSAAVRAIALQEGGAVLVGGDFLRFSGVTRHRLARVDSTGALDLTFSPDFDGAVRAVLVQPDGKILVGGSFTQVNSNAVSGLVRLNNDGTLDPNFKVGTGVVGVVNALGLQSDGSVIVGGLFGAINGVSVTNLARLTTVGQLDSTFALAQSPDGVVLSLAVHSSDRIYVAGAFTTLDGQSRNGFARLRPDGGLDTQFGIGTGADATVRSIVVAPNSSCYIGGDFSTVNGQVRRGFARIHGDEKLTRSGVEFAIGSVTVNEGVGTVPVLVKRTGDTNLDFSVRISSVPQKSSATAGEDYVAVDSLLHFAPGVVSQSITVTIIDDALPETTESIGLQLSDAPSGVDLSGLVSMVILIQDNESSVSFATSNYTIAEGGSNVLVTVVRQGNTNSAVSVQLTTADGTAQAGQDYVATTVAVSFAPTEIFKTVAVGILQDSLQEGTEAFTVNLSSATGVLIGLGTATVSITDDDFDKIELAGSALIADANNNGVIDPGETVTMNIALRNTGTANSTNVSATLLAQNQVVPVTTSQVYGPMVGGGDPVTRSFTFKNTVGSGGSLNLVLQLNDGGRDLGQVTLALTLGQQTKSYANSSAITILDNAIANPYPSQITISGLSGAPLKVTVTLDGLTHGAVGDIDMMLVAPNGERTVIMSDVGGDNPVTDAVITLDDSAAAALPFQGAFGSGTYRPTNYVANDRFPDPAPSPGQTVTKSDLKFSNLTDANGTWSLYVLDDTPGDSGLIKNGWSLNIATSGQIVPVTDVGVSILESSDPVVLGQNLTYTLRVANNGPALATGITVQQTLPAGVTFVSASGGATQSGGVVSASIVSLNVGAFIDFQIVVKPTIKGVLTTSATVTAKETDIFAGNNSKTVTTTVSDQAVAVILDAALAGNSLTLSWPSTSDGVLEASATVGGANWTAVSGAPTLVGDRYTITILVGEGARFFRLHQP